MADTRSIFLTGFPGFIAGRLVERLAGTDVQFYLLVQPALTALAEEAIGRIAERTGAPLENFFIVEGDITKDDLGIEPEDLEEIRARTTDVFHLAAVYDLAVARDIAYLVNLDGTKNVNAFVRGLPNLRRYNYVSTCYVAGKRTGRILETELEHQAGFRNHYEKTKYLAEIEVERLKKDFPVTIFRPSVVVGDSRTGETAKYDGIYYLVHYLRKAPRLLRLINVGNKKVKLNLVPIDFVVEGLAALSKDEAAIGTTVALADPAPLTTAKLFDAIASTMTGRRSVLTPPPALVEWSLSLPFSPPITGLPHHGVPYFFIEQTYDTSVAAALLKRHDIRCPNFRDYVADLLEYVDTHPQI